MCTLSFVPSLKNSEKFTVTSNRDESPNRKTIAPKTYSEMGIELLYPKDEVAGGTWIGASSKNRLVCLMNGAFGPHERKESYRMSRGVVVKKMLASENTERFIENVDLEAVEPFTIIVVDWGSKLELRKLIWDGTKKYSENLPVQPYIWSASMLYSEETKRERERIFENFIKEHSGKLSEKQLLEFHKCFIIDRTFVKTTSITQFVRKAKTSKMVYNDLQTEKPFQGSKL
ncbi:MAG TPA: NRDE family protein [Flavobacteriaceae bacterium]|nr:NRDE family protein [Flavobacteriaceae bacterium]